MDEQSQKPSADTADAAPSCEVYYDGECPMCRAEIGFYQKGGSEAQFTNIAAPDTDGPGEIDKAAALKRFHVRRADGRLVSGAAAFAELWKATPGWRWLGHIGAVPPFVWIGEGLYRVFLVVRPFIQRAMR